MSNIKGKILIALISLITLVGCKTKNTLKDVQTEIGVKFPEKWVSQNSNQTEDNPIGWLNDIKDENLTNLVNEAIQKNWDIKAATARVNSALAQAKIDGASLKPNLNFDLGASRAKRTSSSGFALSNVRSNNYNLGLSTNWEIDLWGRLRHQKHAALSDLNAATMDKNSISLSVAGNVAKSWCNLIEAKLQVSLAQKTVKSFEDSLINIEQGFRTGINSALDVRLARANVFGAKNRLYEAQSNFQSSKRQVEILLGRYPGAEIETNKSFPKLKQQIPVGLPMDLLMRRPDLIAGFHRLSAKDHRWINQKRNWLPSLALTGSGGTSSSKFKNLMNSNFGVWNIAAAIMQPIYEGGRLSAERAMALASRNESLAEFSQLVLVALQEVEDGITNEPLLYNREMALESAKDESVTAETIALERYQKGLENITTLLEAQRRSFDAQSNYLSIKNLRIQNRLNLYLALGGDFFVEDKKNEVNSKQ